MNELVSVLIGGVSIGLAYAIMAIGLSLLYGATKIFNFAYGSFLIWGAYFAWLLLVPGHLVYPLVFLIVIPVMFLSGMVVERCIFRSLRCQENWQVVSMMATLALAILMDNLALVTFGPFAKTIPPLLQAKVEFGGISVGATELGIFLIAASSVLAIDVFLNKTILGMSMRAVSQDEEGTRIVGIPFNKVYSYAFGISTALVGISGILLASKYFIAPMKGWDPFIKAFIIVVFGGLGSIRGTLYGAIILGVSEALVAWKLGSAWVMIFWFFILLTVLMVRPTGLFGKWS